MCAPPRPARAHVLTSGSGSAPLEARSPVSPPGDCAHPAVLGSLERPFPIRHPVSVLQVCWREQGPSGLMVGREIFGCSFEGVNIPLGGESWGLRSKDASTCFFLGGSKPSEGRRGVRLHKELFLSLPCPTSLLTLKAACQDRKSHRGISMWASSRVWQVEISSAHRVQNQRHGK